MRPRVPCPEVKRPALTLSQPAAHAKGIRCGAGRPFAATAPRSGCGPGGGPRTAGLASARAAPQRGDEETPSMSAARTAPQGRFPPIPPERMTPEQRQAAEAIAGGPRGGVRGPFNALLRSPALADRFQRVGEYLRFNSSIPAALNEFAILIAAREWSAQYEWYAHHRLAMQAGLSPAIAQAVAEGRRPEGMSADEALVHEFCTELHRSRTVSDATFERARDRFGEQGVVDLLGVSGYYVAVAMVLNVAQVPLPEGVPPPLAPLPPAR